jgi:multidrug resistance efflux pump
MTKQKSIMISVLAALLIIGIIGGGAYFYVSAKTVSIDSSVVFAPTINLTPLTSGALQKVFVKAGDTIAANQPVAQVGDEIIESKTAGQIVTINQNIGEFENAASGQAVIAKMIDPTQLRVVGHLDENKGLANIHVGDSATFTVDAFGSKNYQGIVDEISPMSEQGSVVFDISSQRPTNQFSVFVRFDPKKYPELKNGMSARVWVYTK